MVTENFRNRFLVFVSRNHLPPQLKLLPIQVIIMCKRKASIEAFTDSS